MEIVIPEIADVPPNLKTRKLDALISRWTVKLADPDRVELTNFNRAERVSLRHLVQSRSQRIDPGGFHKFLGLRRRC